MTDASEPLTTRPIRHDGWTAERRRRFHELLAAGLDVRRACAGVGLSRQAAYALRRREPAFAEAWDGALSSARAADEAAFYAMLPERLRRTLSELSGECNLRDVDGAAQSRFASIRITRVPAKAGTQGLKRGVCRTGPPPSRGRGRLELLQSKRNRF